ncbi:MAG: oligosaccharide flippase family protein [Actinomycetota bacterium]|nr:oligosaccharide flippase family protein [Actinomycetota bacterium]
MSTELGIGRALGGVAATAWLAVAAHRLSITNFGRLTLVLSLGSLVSIGTDLGIPLALAKLSCDHDELDKRVFAGAVRRRAQAGLAAAVLLVALWVNAGHGSMWWLAALYGVSIVVSPVTSSFMALLRGKGSGAIEAGYELFSKIVLLSAGIAVLAAGKGVTGAMAVYVLVDSGSAVVVPLLVRRQVRFSDTPDPTQHEELRLRQTLPLAAGGIVGSAYERIDIWLMALLLGSTGVALYAVAYKLYDTLLMPAKAIASSAVAAAGKGVIQDGKKVATRLAAKTLMVTVPLAAVAAAWAPSIIRAGFGGHFGRSDNALRILAATAVPGAVLAVITPIALLRRRRMIVAWTAAGLVGNIAANLILVPTVGVAGASIAFLITETGLMVVFWISLSMPVSPPKPLGRPIDVTEPPTGYPAAPRP